jgi:hypothetical protein
MVLYDPYKAVKIGVSGQCILSLTLSQKENLKTTEEAKFLDGKIDSWNQVYGIYNKYLPAPML